MIKKVIPKKTTGTEKLDHDANKIKTMITELKSYISSDSKIRRNLKRIKSLVEVEFESSDSN